MPRPLSPGDHERTEMSDENESAVKRAERLMDDWIPGFTAAYHAEAATAETQRRTLLARLVSRPIRRYPRRSKVRSVLAKHLRDGWQTVSGTTWVYRRVPTLGDTAQRRRSYE